VKHPIYLFFSPRYLKIIINLLHINRVFLEKLIVSKVVKNSPAF